MHASTRTVVAVPALLALIGFLAVRSTDADSRIHSSSSTDSSTPSIPKDAHEGETILLECRFDPTLISRDRDDKVVYYWHRTNQGLTRTEPAAINDSPLDPSYRVDFNQEAGRYDLRVDRASYERDNGLFQCKIVISGSGTVLKAANYLVTILNPPDPPVITPSQAVAKESEPFRLECSSKGGSPDPTIQWFREGDDRPLEKGSEVVFGGTRAVPTRNTLTLASPRLEDDGSRYRCVVYNRAYPEQKLEATVRLTVHYKPRITVGPYNPLAVSVDGNAEMSCSVQANPPARAVRWTKGGQIVATSPNHTILRVKPEDSGAYDCSAENAVGRSSAALELSVLHGPIVSIDRVPTSTTGKGQEAKAGDHVQLRCTVTSNPPAHRIVWSKVGDPSFKAAPGPLLNFAAITADDIGTYVCSATATLTPSGAAASAGVERTGNASTILQIQHKPGKTWIMPAEPEVVAGRHFTLTCGANPPGYPPPEYEWWREGAELQKLGKRANYTFTALHVSDEGRYYCQPANQHGRGSIGSAYMRVNEPASVALPMKPTHEAKEGDSNFKLTCIGRGKPRPAVVWTHNDVEINPESGEYRVENREQNEDADVKVVTTTLYFEAMARKGANSLSAADRGTYACHFDNGIEREAKSSTVLRVEHTPVVRHTYNRVAFDVGEVAILQCKVSAYPTPRFEWTFGGKGSNSNSGTPLDAEHSEGRYGTNSTELPDDLHLGTLSIRSTRESDYGDYTCRATNSAGDDDERTIIKLVKKSPPETPTSLEVLEVLADSVSLRWVEGFNGGFNSNTEFVVNYHDTVQSRNESCRTMNPCKVTGLESRHEYQFRVLAVNPRGFSSYSDPIKVTTKVNLKDMPSAFDSSYDRERNVLSFRVEPADVSLRLMAKIEVRADGHQNQIQQNQSQGQQTPQSSGNSHQHTPWTSLTSVEVLSDLENVYLKSTPEAITDIRVILCLASNESWCGYEHLVKMDSVYRDPRVASTTDHLISVLLTCAVFAAVAFLLIVCCCLKRREGKDDEKKAGKKGADFESDTSSGGHSGSTSQALGGKGSGGSLGAGFYSSHDNKGLMSDMDAKTLAAAAAGIYGSTLGSLMNAQGNGNYGGGGGYQHQSGHIPQNYYLTGDGSEASPNGSNETQTEFWNTMKSGQMFVGGGGTLAEQQQAQAMAMGMADMGQQELMGYGGGYNGQMDSSQGYLNAYNTYNYGGGGGGYQPLDEETLSRKNQMNMYYDEMNGNYHTSGGPMTFDHLQQQSQSGDDMVDGYPNQSRARVMSEIIV